MILGYKQCITTNFIYFKYKVMARSERGNLQEVLSLDLKKIEQQIEQERRILNQMAEEHGIRDHRVIDQSEQLDRILDSYLQHKHRKGDHTATGWS